MKNVFSCLGLSVVMASFLTMGCNSGDSATTSTNLTSSQVQETGNVTSALSSTALGSSNLSLVANDGEGSIASALRSSDIMAAVREMKFYSPSPNDIRWSLVTEPTYWEDLDFDFEELEQEESTGPREFNALTDCSESESGNSFTLTCESDEVLTESCGSTTYTFSGLDMTLQLTVNESIFAIGMNMSTTVSGGEFSSDLVACNFTLQVDLSGTNNNFDEATSMEGCSCSINGESVGCDDLENSWEGSSCNSFESQ